MFGMTPSRKGNQNRGQMTTRGAHPLDQFRREMDALFDRFFAGWPRAFGEEDMGAGLGLDVEESEKEIIVRADVPGFDPNELDVQLTDDTLTIQAEKEQKGDGARSYRSFYRSVTLPAGIDAEKVKADYRNGVLELHMPRPEGAAGKRIPISAEGSRAGQAKPAIGETSKTQPEAPKGKTQQGKAEGAKT